MRHSVRLLGSALASTARAAAGTRLRSAILVTKHGKSPHAGAYIDTLVPDRMVRQTTITGFRACDRVQDAPIV